MEPTTFFKSLADDTRLRSLLLMQDQGELCVCELTVALAQTQTTISRHLAILRKAGLTLDRKVKQWVYYQINPDLPPWAIDVLQQTYAANRAFIEENIKHLEQMGHRPQRQNTCC